jgi:hypothetical protein
MNLFIEVPNSRSRSRSTSRPTYNKETSIDKKHKEIGFRNIDSFENEDEWLKDTLIRVHNVKSKVTRSDNPYRSRIPKTEIVYKKNASNKKHKQNNLTKKIKTGGKTKKRNTK